MLLQLSAFQGTVSQSLSRSVDEQSCSPKEERNQIRGQWPTGQTVTELFYFILLKILRIQTLGDFIYNLRSNSHEINKLLNLKIEHTFASLLMGNYEGNKLKY